MSILLLLVPVSVLLLGLAIWAFVWSVRSGQFDDVDTAPLDILVDDDEREVPMNPDQHAQNDHNDHSDAD